MDDAQCKCECHEIPCFRIVLVCLRYQYSFMKAWSHAKIASVGPEYQANRNSTQRHNKVTPRRVKNILLYSVTSDLQANAALLLQPVLRATLQSQHRHEGNASRVRDQSTLYSVLLASPSTTTRCVPAEAQEMLRW